MRSGSDLVQERRRKRVSGIVFSALALRDDGQIHGLSVGQEALDSLGKFSPWMTRLLLELKLQGPRHE